MSNYRRAQTPGGTFFFTVNLAVRGETMLTDRIDELRRAYRSVGTDMPFTTRAVVVLPDHIHAIWTLPEGDSDFSTRWRRIKRAFTVSTGETRGRSRSKRRKGEAGLWQRRFWERCVRDEAELAACVRYVWGNPVKHGLVTRAVEWPYSSVHREIAAGRLPPEGP
ncbi:REP-associated tyrosine transposase [Jannaschia sp. M317]|uniref:REP-associated tyrosine transposase n=1 Tax=Jannaschia sp. M317 TaxID=2867011 RepID=UPI0021A45AE3|nr:transposase [Jannaschia sp. M317]UWQ17098.1 transposase [Jannaschia sp. M317]